MAEPVLLQVASIPVLGVTSLWLAWRLGLPSIFILLTVGIVLGPGLGLINPTELIGDLLYPIISISVAIILFEGGLTLNMADLKKTGKSVRNLVSIGNIITWITTSLAAYYILGLNLKVAILLGSILVVTGPTVIIPLLGHVRPKKKLATILRWEGITIDPIGALQAVFVLEVILAASIGEAFGVVATIFLKTLLIGFAVGLTGALGLVVFIKKHWVPDFLQEAITLMLVIGTYVLSDYFQPESGLLTVTIMGIILANQKLVTIKHIITFKENLTLLLLSTVFIILAANLELQDLLLHLNMNSMFFLGAVIFIARPLCVFCSTIGAPLSINGKLFLSWMAPRGIVAAAVASLFAIKLENIGVEQASSLVSLTFLVIISTVVLYGLTAKPVARLLGVLQPNRQGVLIVGAHDWARSLAKVLLQHHINTLIVDTNKQNILTAKEEGINAVHGSILGKKIGDEIEMSQIGQLVALTPSDEVNLLAVIEYESLFGRENVFRISPEAKQNSQKSTEKKFLFSKGTTFTYISARLTAGSDFKSVMITDSFSFKTFTTKNPKAIPMFIITQQHHLIIIRAESDISPKPGQLLIYLGS